MGFVTAPRQVTPRVPLRHGEGDKDHLTSLGGLAALSLDALSSVAYGPEAIVLVLVGAGVSALRLTLPITVAIAGLLAVLVVSYRQVIAVHPDGGGAYAVGKKDLGATVSLLAAASLVVDYVLTVAVSLAAGAASLASAFPSLAHHLLALCLIGLLLITAVNLWGIAESARALMLPMVIFVCAIFGVIAVGLTRSHPAALVGGAQPIRVSEAVGVILILKAFAAGCSALTGVEAIANGVPSFREPRVKRAQRTELMLGALLGAMLIGLAVLIHREHVAPRGGVTVLAQLTAGSFGTGWAYYATNIAVTVVLALAANTSFGGLPVLMSLLSADDRLPHLLGLRAERPVFRYGVIALAALAALLLVAVNATTDRLIPLYAIGVFIGFTISQAGLVRHWYRGRPRGWALRAVLNGTGAVLTAVAAVVFVLSKFTSGAWVVVITVPALMLLFSRIESYYRAVGLELGMDRIPDRPCAAGSLVIVPVGGINRLTEYALCAALSLGDEVVAVSVHLAAERSAAFRAEWDAWNPGVRLDIIESPHRSLVHPILDYIQRAQEGDRQVAVLIPEVEPRARRYRILQNQRGLLLATVLRARTDVLVCTLPYRLTTR
ncbi:MAG TPA: APC family permease [Actinocrinis sp.]|jgi:amino acid transporter|uniref:APC family permease n=1 Tax=Actinocrinis sp. TaxID=1920516 RepID=UPI002DDD5ACC|nr:APC family permease [Actinocrinis sp.]HEV3169298.1 APC family permease [Actinocrinis sp.]